MGQKMEVKMYCQTGKGAFIAVFEELKPEEWYSMEAKMLPPPPPAQKPSFLQKIGLMKSPEPVRSAPQKKMQVKGAFFIGDMKCPFCGNTSFVKCGSCGELTCFPADGKYFKCIPCGNSGEVSGTISDMSGDMDNGGNGDMSSLSRSNTQQRGGPTLS